MKSLKFLCLAIIFSIAYTQDPLYTENQHAKFLHGLAQSGLGFLDQDWLAKTLDPIPVFSFLVKVTYTYLGQNTFYFYYALLFGIYIYSLFGIASYLFKIDDYFPKYLTYLAIFIFIHSIEIKILGLKTNVHLHYGLAEQFVLGHRFQPSSFGVLVILSIYIFLLKKPFLAVLLLAVAATFHPTYLPSAAILTLSYMLITYKDQDKSALRKTLLIGVLGFISVFPVFIYMSIVFAPTSPEIWAKAMDIIINFRIPHHTLPEVWLNNLTAYVQITIMIFAIYLVRKTRLFTIMLLPFITAASLTIYQLLSQDNSLGFLFPWRVSAFLVPISTSIILAYWVSYIFERYHNQIDKNRKWVRLLAVVSISLLVIYGAVEQVYKLRYEDSTIPMMNFVKENKQPGETYLVPIKPERFWKLGKFWKFRLYTGAPIFVNVKSHPYKDIEVIEWYRRMRTAQSFYDFSGKKDSTSRCNILTELADNDNVTNVVLLDRDFELNCSNLSTLYEDNKYGVYKIID